MKQIVCVYPSNMNSKTRRMTRLDGEARTYASIIEDGEHKTLVCRCGLVRDVCTKPIRVAILAWNASLRLCAVGVRKRDHAGCDRASGAAEQ